MNTSSPTDLRVLRELFSPARLAPYEEIGRSINKVKELYETDILKGLRFMLVMHFLEIAMRNDMDKAMRSLSGPLWFLREGALLPEQTRHVVQAQESLRWQNKPAIHDNYIAELPLGFWVGLLARKYEGQHHYWRRCLHECFAHRPRRVQRQELYKKLDTLRRFRNRVAHHERIMHRRPGQKLQSALQALGWLSPELRAWARQLVNRIDMP